MRKRRHFEIANTAKERIVKMESNWWNSYSIKGRTDFRLTWKKRLGNDRRNGVYLLEMKILIKLETLEKRDESHNLNEEKYRHRMEVVLLKARIRCT